MTLWELLCGERPFAGDTLAALTESVLGGVMRSPPRGRAVPGWLRRACARGLSVEPAQRFPSVEALLDALVSGQRAVRWPSATDRRSRSAA